MSAGLPRLSLGDRLDLTPDGCAYELENGNVMLVALCLQFDENEAGLDRARAEAVDRMRAKLPVGYDEPEPCGDWVDLLSSGYFGYARKFIAKVKP